PPSSIPVTSPPPPVPLGAATLSGRPSTQLPTRYLLHEFAPGTHNKGRPHTRSGWCVSRLLYGQLSVPRQRRERSSRS
ncbi:hypothetical protein, partial [uncultured Aminobacterium sp.]|uniref:hypothetical protein n=1 Tax=uncultured Aminobacterium sp. TaxID=548265 RepID=UPI00259153B0